MNAVFQLLTELSIDPFRLDDFLRDPDSQLTSRGIRPEDVPPVLHSGGIALDGAWARGAAFTDPGYDPLPDPDVPESPELDLA